MKEPVRKDAALPVLAIDSSTATGSVAIGSGERVLAEVNIQVQGGLSAALMPAIDYAMRTAGLRPSNLTAVVVGSGPGSFTGIRVAAATAKGMVHALGIPLLAYSSLLATAAPFAAANGGVVGVLFDARGGDVFAACFRFGSRVESRVPPAAMALDEAVGAFRDEGTSLLVGDGATKHHPELSAVLNLPIAPFAFSSPRAASLIWLADAYPELGRVADPGTWEPDYLRPSGAERIAAATMGADKQNATVA
jgi:tRNA threonylcarbamoyladenosine biosynthesis protein TsaB